MIVNLQLKQILKNITNSTHNNKIFSKIQKKYIATTVINNRQDLLDTITNIKNDPILKSYDIKINLNFNLNTVISFDKNLNVAFDSWKSIYTNHKEIGYPGIDKNFNSYIDIVGDEEFHNNSLIGPPSFAYEYTNFDNRFKIEIHDHDDDHNYEINERWIYTDIDIELLNEIHFNKNNLKKVKDIWENMILNKYTHKYIKFDIS